MNRIKFPKIKISPRLLSRKLWLAILSAVFPVFNETFEWGLEPEMVVQAITGLWLFIIAEGVGDAVGRLNAK